MPKYDDFMDISIILNDYSNAIYEEMHEASKEVANKGAKTLRQTSPKKTGKYRKGWRVKDSANTYSFSDTIHNSTNWQLTHLLEKSHLKRNGGKTKPQVHIYPVEQECINEYEKDCIDIIKKESK